MTMPSTPEPPAPGDAEADQKLRAEVDEKVRAIVAEALGRDLALVTPEASLTEDLGAESLDLLDIVFRIERTFEVQITRGEMERAARGDMTDEQFAPGGVISAAGLDRLRALMPEARARIVPGLRPAQILTLFTARTFASIVEGKRQQQPG